MLLFVGLGNPGSQYVRNRHNIGFMAVDAIRHRHGFSPWKRRFQGVTAEGTLGAEKILLLLPGTYMNDSGRAVQEAANFYKIDLPDIVVFQDEVELPPGKLRMKTGGGNAGHNGLRSIDAMIGPDYWRVRIGIGHPGIKELVHPYVLQNFTADEARLIVTPLLDAVTETIPLLVEGAPDAFMSEVARRFTPPDLDEEPSEK